MSRLLRAGPSRAHRADPARRRAARRGDRQRHARRRRRPGPAPLDRRRAHLADRPCRGGLGRQARSRSSSTWCAGTCATPPIWRREARDDEPRRIPQPSRRASPTSCPGRRWSERASSSTRTARSSARRAFADPDLDSATPAELVGDHRPAQQRAAPPRLRLGDLRRGAADRRPDLSAQRAFPIRRRRWSMPSAGRSSRKTARISRAAIS